MKIYTLDDDLDAPVAYKEKGYCFSIGVFDGVHEGHRAVIRTLVETSQLKSLIPCVFTFDVNPKDSFRSCPIVLTDNSERERLLSSLGVQILFYISFTDTIKAMSGADFMDKISASFPLDTMVCGRDFRLGSPEYSLDYQAISEHYGIALKIVDDICIDGQRVSSTAIRQKIAQHKII